MPSILLDPGSRLGKYEIEGPIARGGMGMVYKAKDIHLGRIVALKVLSDEFARNSTLLERFQREARHAARLNHPNIVTLFDQGHDQVLDLFFLALEFVAGIDLRKHIEKRGRLAPAEARYILIQATKALDHAFERGIVHRDIKPSNFLLARDGKKLIIKLTDLGLARRANDEEFRVTKEGSTVGTIDYLAPEQARDSAAADTRSDIYSLGCTAYHMLAGVAPFATGGLGERLYKHMETQAVDVRQFNPQVTAKFWAIIQKMLEKDPADRYATPRELLLALKGMKEKRPESPRTVLNSKSPTVLKAEPQPPPEDDAENADASGDSVEIPAPVRKKKKKRTTPSAPALAVPTATPLISPEQARAAVAFHERALQVLAEGGGDDYARQLLVNCLNADPFTTVYRQTLRDITKQSAAGLVTRWFGAINVLASKSKMRLARTASNWRKVLEVGEEILARQPADVDTHVEMASAAKELGSKRLAVWLLEKGREQTPNDLTLLKAMAQLLEELEEWQTAVALWERIQAISPDDSQASHKIKDLLARGHIALGSVRR